MTHVKVKNSNLVPDFFNLMDTFFADDYTIKASHNKPSVNVVELDNAYRLDVIAPGLQKSDFKIAIEKDLLTVSYEKKEETTEQNEKSIRTEYSFQSFKRSFTLTDKLDTENISAKYEQGILSIQIAKAANKDTETKTVEIV